MRRSVAPATISKLNAAYSPCCQKCCLDSLSFWMNTILLIITLLAISVAPGIYFFARRRAALLSFFDGFVLVTVSGLVLLDVLPGAIRSGGLWSLGFAAAGMWGPTALERLLHRLQRETHTVTLVLAIAGLILHSLGDGAALSPIHAEGTEALGLAVVLHSVPISMLVWWLMYPVFGLRLPMIALFAMMAGTLVGYLHGVELSNVLGGRGSAWFQALVAGSVLHVAFGRPHIDIEARWQRPGRFHEGLGNLAGAASIWLLHALHTGGEHLGAVDNAFSPGDFGYRLLTLALLCAPGLLVTSVLAGLLTLRRAGAATIGSQRLAALFAAWRGLVLPQPGAAATGDAGRNGAATILGLGALLISVPLLGWGLTLARLGAAALVVTGFALLDRRRNASPPAELEAAAELPTPTLGTSTNMARKAAADRLRTALNLGLVRWVDHNAPGAVAGLALAAALAPIAALVPWLQIPEFVQVLAFALLGLPFFLSAVGCTPLAAVFIAAGASPGAALALLMTAPLAGITRAEIGGGWRPHLRYAASLVLACGMGALVNGLPVAGLPAETLWSPSSDEAVQTICLALLGGLLVGSLLRLGGRAFLALTLSAKQS